jgi:hypothetical protein
MRKTIETLQRVLAFSTSFEVFFGAFHTPFFTDSYSVSFHSFFLVKNFYPRIDRFDAISSVETGTIGVSRDLVRSAAPGDTPPEG